MILERVYDDKLAQASYLVGCAATGEALVVDPHRDADEYVALAEKHNLRITHVTETHIHADFVSGARELAGRTGARLYLSAEGGSDWQYAFAEEAGATLLRDGEHFMVGNIRVRALHTPGHTPEHLSFEITDTAGADRPMGVFTGDFIFVGDVGRPDLLEKAAKIAGTMEAGARTLFASLQRFKREVPDWVQIWPGHGAGSACGKSLGAVPSTTLGYEKLFNWGVAADDEALFVKQVLAGQPEPPKYFAEMKRINREGPRILGGFTRPRHLDEEKLARLVEAGETVVDTRPAAQYALEHVPGTINIPLNRSFNTWAGWLLDYDRDFWLIVSDDSHALIDEAVRDLAMIGLDRVGGYFTAGAIETWATEHRQIDTVRHIRPGELVGMMERGEVAVVDVRGAAEWEAGHLPGVPNIPLGYLSERLDEIPRDRPVVVQCEAGGRSAIAASVLQAHGIQNVANLSGGFRAWAADGHPVEKAEAEPAAV